MELKEALAEIDRLKEQSDIATAAATKANGESKDRRLEAKTLKEQLAAYDGIDLEEFNSVKAKAAQLEQDRLKDSGRFDEALTKDREADRKMIEQQSEMIKGQNSELSTMKLDNAFKLGMGGNAVNEEHALIIARQSLKMEDGIPVVYDGDKPRLNGEGQAMTPTEYGAVFLAENPQHAKASGGGSGSQGNNGNTQTNDVPNTSVGKITQGLKDMKK